MQTRPRLKLSQRHNPWLRVALPLAAAAALWSQPSRPGFVTGAPRGTGLLRVCSARSAGGHIIRRRAGSGLSGQGDVIDVKCEGQWLQAVVERKNADGTVVASYSKDGHRYYSRTGFWRVKEKVGVPKVRPGSKGDSAEGEHSTLPTSTARPKADLSGFEGIPNDVWHIGEVVAINLNGAMVSVNTPGGGEACVGMVQNAEMKNGHVETTADAISVGQMVEVRVKALDLRRGRMSLSMRDVNASENLPDSEGISSERREESLDGLPPKTGDIRDFEGIGGDVWLDGVVSGIQSYGAFVRVSPPSGGGAYEGLVHASEISSEPGKTVTEVVQLRGQVRVRVKALNLEDGRLDLSMRDPDGIADLSDFKDISADSWLDGVVAGLMPFGAFVSVKPPSGKGALEGLLHKSEMTSEFAQNFQDVWQLGQQVKVQVKAVNLQAKRLDLTMKADLSAFDGLGDDVWLDGIVRGVKPFGAFVQTQAPSGAGYYEGLLHISEIKFGHVEMDDEFEVGQAVKVKVKTVDLKGKTLSLTMLERQDLSVFEGLSEEEWLPGTVESFSHPRGVVVTLRRDAGAELCRGFVPRSEIKHEHVENVGDEVAVGQSVQVRVISLEGGKLKLSMKEFQDLAPFKEVPEDQWLPGVVYGFLPFGVLVAVQPPAGGKACVGTVHLFEMSDVLVESIEGAVSIGQEVSVRVCSVLDDHLDLSMKEKPDLSGFQNVSSDTWFNAVVTDVSHSRGAVAVLQPPGGGAACRGWLSSSEIKAGPVDNVADELNLGQAISVRVKFAEFGKLKLSMKEP